MGFQNLCNRGEILESFGLQLLDEKARGKKNVEVPYPSVWRSLSPYSAFLQELFEGPVLRSLCADGVVNLDNWLHYMIKRALLLNEVVLHGIVNIDPYWLLFLMKVKSKTSHAQ